MEVKTSAYKLSGDGIGFIGITVSNNLVLYNNIIGTLGDVTDIAKDFKILEEIEPTSYEIEFLTRFHPQKIRMKYNVKITYNNLNHQQRTLYLKVNWLCKQKLKWMNKLFFIQKGDNGWRAATLLATVIVISIGILTYKANTRVNILEHENENYKIIITKLQKEIQERDKILQERIDKSPNKPK